jgi:hypothetical protein
MIVCGLGLGAVVRLQPATMPRGRVVQREEDDCEVAIIRRGCIPPLPMSGVSRPAITSSRSRHGVISKPPGFWQIDPVSDAVPPRPSSQGLPLTETSPRPNPPGQPAAFVPPDDASGFVFFADKLDDRRPPESWNHLSP